MENVRYKSTRLAYISLALIPWLLTQPTMVRAVPEPAATAGAAAGSPEAKATPTAAPKSSPPAMPSSALKADNPKAIEQKWGIQIISLHSTAAGHMLDFRFKVLNPKKAAPLLDRKNKPYLLSDKFKGKVEVPTADRVGSLRQTTQHAEKGKVYTMLFGNPGKLIQPGSTVGVVIGDFAVSDVRVVDPMTLPRPTASGNGPDQGSK